MVEMGNRELSRVCIEDGEDDEDDEDDSIGKS